jgi:hypothetical protein
VAQSCDERQEPQWNIQWKGEVMFNILKQLIDNNTQLEPDPTPDCAWCMEEQGVDLGDGSHGICQPHANQITYQYHTRKFERTPSYTTRYRDGQQAYWGEED